MPQIIFSYSKNQFEKEKLPVNYDASAIDTLGYKLLEMAPTYPAYNLSGTSAGYIFYDITILDLPTVSFDTELGYIYFSNSANNANSIQFTVSVLNAVTPGILTGSTSGITYNFSITGGTGIYTSIKGTVQIIAFTNGIRNVTINY